MSRFEGGEWEAGKKNIGRMWVELESWGDRQGLLQSKPRFVDSGLDPEAVETRDGPRAGSSPVKLPLRKVNLLSEGKWPVGEGRGLVRCSAVGQGGGQG